MSTEPPSMDAVGAMASANNSSDFVRKLYKMLEDPSYSYVVRWGDEGDSFVVLENEKFTKSILPKHFKHSNFASFVRQLNKYDFHKVRQNNEEGGTSPYGPNAWEFKHPEFKANNKESLDNIRRKAPAPRKPTTITETDMPSQQINLMNQQLVAQSHLLEQLSQRYSELMGNHQMVLQEVSRVQKTMLNHEQVIQNIMIFLHTLDKQRRDSKLRFNPADTTHSAHMTPNGQPVAVADDEPATPLQQASKLMSDLTAEMQFNAANMNHLRELSGRPLAALSTPPADTRLRVTNGMPQVVETSADIGYPRLNNGELDQVVYPMGTTNGIDPMYGEHVNNIPYSMPPKELDPSDPRRHYVDGRKHSTLADPGWSRPPRILLVEDDPTCRQIGGKFLYSFCCVVDSALDGLEAVNKLQEGIKYDMILMDIIMPNLDGVSACHIIRQFDRTPIIAMTSNIRSDDIQMYFQHGMDDVLPKPFTRKSLLEMLEKHLSQLKKLPMSMEPPPSTGASSVPVSTTQSTKDDASSPSQSPAASMTNWQSPSQYPGISPIHTAIANQYAPMTNPGPYTASPQTPMTAARPVPLQPPPPPPPPASQISQPPQPQRRQLNDLGGAGAPDAKAYAKRQRLNGQSPQGMSMPAPQ